MLYIRWMEHYSIGKYAFATNVAADLAGENVVAIKRPGSTYGTCRCVKPPRTSTTPDADSPDGMKKVKLRVFDPLA